MDIIRIVNVVDLGIIKTRAEQNTGPDSSLLELTKKKEMLAYP